MRAPRHRGLAGRALALALLLTGWSFGAAPAASGEPVTHTVKINAVDYSPKQLTVHAGDTIVWVNEDLFPHTVTAEDGSFDSGDIPGGKSWTTTVSARGSVPYKCIYHRAMIGSLVVE